MLSEAQAMTLAMQEETEELEGVNMIAPTILREYKMSSLICMVCDLNV